VDERSLKHLLKSCSLKDEQISTNGTTSNLNILDERSIEAESPFNNFSKKNLPKSPSQRSYSQINKHIFECELTSFKIKLESIPRLTLLITTPRIITFPSKRTFELAKLDKSKKRKPNRFFGTLIWQHPDFKCVSWTKVRER
jgi:hypothetical protein